jgi:SRSO17 transposase
MSSIWSGVIGHADRHGPLASYCSGLLLPGERKSVEPMAARLALDAVGAKHQSLLAELAEVADLSAMHSRQFKRATGLSPHQYVVRCSIARAGVPEAQPTLPAHIAQAVGLSPANRT